MDDIEAATAAVGNVLSPKTFLAGDKTLRTGTMPTVAIVAANDNYPAGYHAGNAGGLDAIDTDLAPANIKNGVNIFGKTGTVKAVHDRDNHAAIAMATSTISDVALYHVYASGSTWTIKSGYVYSVTAHAMIFGTYGGYFGVTSTWDNNKVKLQFLIAGVQVAESAYVNYEVYNYSEVAYRENVSAGNISIILRGHNYHGSEDGRIKHFGFIGGASAKV